MKSNKDQEKKSKQRYLSPSFKKGVVKESKDKKSEEDEFKIDLMNIGEDDDGESTSPNKNNPKKRLSVQEESSPINKKNHNIAVIKDKEQKQEKQEKHEHHHHHSKNKSKPSEINKDDIKTNSIKEGHVKKIASLSQAGKGEDGFTKVNQDSFLVIQNEYKLNDFNIFAVLDGHGVYGHLISRYVTRFFTAFFKKNKKMNCWQTEDEVFYRLKKNNYDILYRAFRHAERDVGRSEEDANFSGTTCVMVFQVGEKIICANVGDSRAILVKSDSVIPLSIDQKPNDPEEEKRIIEHGGEISQFEEDGEKSGPFRVWKKGEMYPGIAMSRSIGDLLASTLGVIPEPTFIEATIDSNSKFIVIASDGVWEFLDNKAVADLVMPYYKKNDPEGACQCLINESTKWWEKEDIVIDDITCIVVFL